MKISPQPPDHLRNQKFSPARLVAKNGTSPTIAIVCGVGPWRPPVLLMSSSVADCLMMAEVSHTKRHRNMQRPEMFFTPPYCPGIDYTDHAQPSLSR